MATPRLISVVTAVFDGGHHYLKDLYKSLCAQEMPEGWSWEWCVQEDGNSGTPKQELPDNDPRVHYGTGLAGRAAVTRNMALSQAQGIVIRNVDADDVLLPGALSRDIDALHRVAWCVSAGLDLHEDGTTTPGPYDPPNGPVEPGRFYGEQAEDRLSVLAANLAMHTDLIWSLGGWMALTGAETIATLLAAEAVTPGEFIAEPSMLYRKHSAQTTASADYWNPKEDEARRRLIQMRVEAIHANRTRYLPGSIDDDDSAVDPSVPSEARQAQALSRMTRGNEV
ncbi:glycosyltransferase [Amycolatopsis pittospori]|uniref:glycosyltransferase n=1 Tax=Amycolatopsis pittospori TaxID=2749434 RepID=UPI0015F001B0|nr:glycosyltransferase [Amycolatopsis pittospori]